MGHAGGVSSLSSMVCMSCVVSRSLGHPISSSRPIGLQTTQKDVKKMVGLYDKMLSERSSTKRDKRYEAKYKKAASKEDLYDKFWEE